MGTDEEALANRVQHVVDLRVHAGIAELTLLTDDWDDALLDFDPDAFYKATDPQQFLSGLSDLTFTKDQAEQVVRELARRIPRQERDRPRLTSGGQLRDQSDQASYVLELQNTPLEIFVRGGVLAQVRRDERGHLYPTSMNQDLLTHHMSQIADWYDQDGNAAPPATRVVRDVFVRGYWDLPPLTGITRSPVLREDGTVLTESGYDRRTGLIYEPTEDLHIDAPDKPSADDVQAAVELLLEAIHDFPYVDESSKTNTLALMLTPVVRPAIQGPTPMALIDAPTIGTGKTLIATVVSLIATGKEPPLFGAPTDSDEFRKQITSYLNEDTPIVVLDNLSAPLTAGPLAQVLTADVWADRILRKSVTARLPVRATWIATGNNIRLSGEIARRSYLIRINRDTARPFEHTDFLHDPLKPWVKENRSRLLSALLTLARAWFVAGKPAAEVEPMGSFESWSRVIGGILANAGVEGFLANRQELLKEMAEDTAEWDDFLQAWFDALGSKPVLTMELSANHELMGHLPTELALERGRETGTFNTQLGIALRNRKDHVTPTGLALRKAGMARGNKSQWMVVSPETEGQVEAEVARLAWLGSSDADDEPEKVGGVGVVTTPWMTSFGPNHLTDANHANQRTLRIGFFGDGSLDLNYPTRDGSVVWRRELFQRLIELGHEPFYLSKTKRSETADPVLRERVRPYDWREPLDALVIESRRSFFAPEAHKLENYPPYEQAVLLRDWHDGKLGKCAIFALDFDLATREVFSLGARKAGQYLGKGEKSGRWAREWTPWMGEVLQRLQNDLWCLLPMNIKESEFEKRIDGQQYRTIPFAWGYPESIEVEPLPPADRTWDFAYPGSDYGRRDKFYDFYVRAAKDGGFKVGVAGQWDDHGKGKHECSDSPFKEMDGFKSYVEQEAGDNLEFIGGGTTLSMSRVLDEISRAKAVVQISRCDYRKIGYETMRPAEVAASGTVPFVDAALASPGGDVPEDRFKVFSHLEVAEQVIDAIRSGRYEHDVQLWREWLRDTRGTVRDQARRLVLLAEAQLGSVR